MPSGVAFVEWIAFRLVGKGFRSPLTHGAIDSVIPPQLASSIPVRSTEASRKGLKYRAANGMSILNKGQRDIKGYTNEANLVDMAMQVCEVTKPLVSVRTMVKAGNRIAFDKWG